MIFVDTGAWFALFIPSDQHHQEAVRLRHPVRDQVLVASTFALDELFTLMRMRGANDRVAAIGDFLLDPANVLLEHVSPSDFIDTWTLFQRFADKGWSFTDCSSFVLMDRLEVDFSFAFDHHFEQYGLVPVLR